MNRLSSTREPKRRRAVTSLVAVGLVGLALFGAELVSTSSRLTIGPPPAGFELDQFGARSLQSAWWYDRQGVGYNETGNPRTSVSATISTYDLVAFRFLLGYLELKPAPSFPISSCGWSHPSSMVLATETTRLNVETDNPIPVLHGSIGASAEIRSPRSQRTSISLRAT